MDNLIKEKYDFLLKKYLEDLEKLERLSRIIADRYDELLKLQKEIETSSTEAQNE